MPALHFRFFSQGFPILLASLALTWPVSGQTEPEVNTAHSISELYKQAIASPIRTEADRKADARRKPLDFLQLTKVQPGMHVLDVSAGGGYSTQLLALVAGKSGKVWAQGPSIRPALKERLASHPQPNIMPVTQPFDDPVPNGISGLDLITIIYNYHDIAYMPVDRKVMDIKLFNALEPGGHLVVIDHAAKAGAGTTVARTLHRIDEAVVKNEFLQAGFRLEAESNAFRNPADPRDKPFFKMSMPTDSFALRFVKP